MGACMSKMQQQEQADANLKQLFEHNARLEDSRRWQEKTVEELNKAGEALAQTDYNAFVTNVIDGEARRGRFASKFAVDLASSGGIELAARLELDGYVCAADKTAPSVPLLHIQWGLCPLAVAADRAARSGSSTYSDHDPSSRYGMATFASVSTMRAAVSYKLTVVALYNALIASIQQPTVEYVCQTRGPLESFRLFEQLAHADGFATDPSIGTISWASATEGLASRMRRQTMEYIRSITAVHRSTFIARGVAAIHQVCVDDVSCVYTMERCMEKGSLGRPVSRANAMDVCARAIGFAATSLLADDIWQEFRRQYPVVCGLVIRDHSEGIIIIPVS